MCHISSCDIDKFRLNASSHFGASRARNPNLVSFDLRRNTEKYQQANKHVHRSAVDNNLFTLKQDNRLNW